MIPRFKLTHHDAPPLPLLRCHRCDSRDRPGILRQEGAATRATAATTATGRAATAAAASTGPEAAATTTATGPEAADGG